MNCFFQISLKLLIHYEIMRISLLPNCFKFCTKYNKQLKKAVFLEVTCRKFSKKSLKAPKKVPAKRAQRGLTFYLLLVTHYKITSCPLLVAHHLLAITCCKFTCCLLLVVKSLFTCCRFSENCSLHKFIEKSQFQLNLFTCDRKII